MSAVAMHLNDGPMAAPSSAHSIRLLVYLIYDLSRARLGRGGRRVALTCGCPRRQGVTLTWHAPTGHRRGSGRGVCPARSSVALPLIHCRRMRKGDVVSMGRVVIGMDPHK